MTSEGAENCCGPAEQKEDNNEDMAMGYYDDDDDDDFSALTEGNPEWGSEDGGLWTVCTTRRAAGTHWLAMTGHPVGYTVDSRAPCRLHSL